MSNEPRCKSCASSNNVDLIAEASLLFGGLAGLKVEPILVYAKITVCADCGFVQAHLSERELEKVREGAAKLKVLPGPEI